MAVTTEGEAVIEQTSALSARYGDLIMGVTSGNIAKFFKVTDESYLKVSVQDDLLITQVQENSGDANIEYVGKALPGAATGSPSWKIKKIDCTTGTIITLADGNLNFDNIWDNRESLSYS